VVSSEVGQNGRTWSHNIRDLICSKLCVNKKRVYVKERNVDEKISVYSTCYQF